MSDLAVGLLSTYLQSLPPLPLLSPLSSFFSPSISPLCPPPSPLFSPSISLHFLLSPFSSRLESHSTSDDQTGYQDMDEVQEWEKKLDPVKRFRGYVESRGLWDQVRQYTHNDLHTHHTGFVCAPRRVENMVISQAKINYCTHI